MQSINIFQLKNYDVIIYYMFKKIAYEFQMHSNIKFCKLIEAETLCTITYIIYSHLACTVSPR